MQSDPAQRVGRDRWARRGPMASDTFGGPSGPALPAKLSLSPRRRTLRSRAGRWAEFSRKLFAPLAAVALFAGCVSLPPAPPVALDHISPEQTARARRNVEVFKAVWRLVAGNQFDPKLNGVDWPAAGVKFGAEAAAAVDDQALYASLNAMLELLNDSHTHALMPVQTEERRTQLRVRTGFNLRRFDGRWAVGEVVPGSPAEAAGVQPGWLVLSRNGEKLGERNEFRPREGEVAQWEFLDAQDRPVSLALVARPISSKSRQIVRELADGFVYLRFDAFDTTDRRWLGHQLNLRREAPGVVIDLRHNSGGGTFSMGITIGEFFDHPVDCGVFITRGGRRSEKNSWQLGSANFRGRVAVLVDETTASAGEIFSAALQDHGRATIVGRKTAGAVLASWFFGLPGGGELQLSLRDYVTPKGRRLEGHGVEPEVAVKSTLADLRASRDPDLDAALLVLRGVVR